MREVPKLEHTGTSTAVAYHFRVNKPLGGWAICTVNDRTGELIIVSDWGSWSHRWSADPHHLGCPTLTHFIADRTPTREGGDYLAMKLLGRDDAREWDREATVTEFRKRLVEMRLERGRRAASRIAGPESIFGRESSRSLTRERARELWDLLGELGEAHDEREFIERFMDESDLVRWVDDTPYESTQHKPSHAYEILTKTILPALIVACAAEVQRRAEIDAKAAPAAEVH